MVRPDATLADIDQLCRDCVTYHFHGALVAPIWLEEARARLEGSDVVICTALGYPMGGMTALAKAFEVRDAIARGAQQIDFMPAIGYLKSGRRDAFRDDMRAVVSAAEGVAVKAMLEFGLLGADEKRIAAELAIEAGVQYVKNSSGWGQGGQATPEDVELLHRLARGRVKVKASGGIRTFEQAVALVQAGAELLGTSAGVAIMEGQPAQTVDRY